MMRTTSKPLFPGGLIALGRQRERRVLESLAARGRSPREAIRQAVQATVSAFDATHLPDDTDRPPEPAASDKREAGGVSKARQAELLRLSGIYPDDADDDQQPQAEGGIIVSEARQRELMRLSGFTD